MANIREIKMLPDTVEVGLFISGSAAKQNIVYSCEQLEAQEKPEIQVFSVYDNHEEKESRDIEEGRGIPLSRYLTAAGIEDAEEIKTKSIDGFESIVTEMKSKRYYFPGLKEENSDGRELREAFVSFFKNGKKVKYYPHPTIMFGQQGLEDKNKDFFAKGVKAIIAGGKDRAFWVKGDALRCSRYFSLDQLFELEGNGVYRAGQASLTFADGSERAVLAVPIPPCFWENEIDQVREDAEIFAVSKDGGRLKLDGKENLWLFFSDMSMKKLGLYNGRDIVESFSGFQMGEMPAAVKRKEVRVPESKAHEGDFYIRIAADKKEIARYDYTLDELLCRFRDTISEEGYYYYNHNMNGGKGGNRLVTAHGWLLADLLEFLPQIADREFLESGAVLFQVFTRDTYKEKIALEGNELTAYRFLLAYEQDQRTETGAEKDDTSAWEDDAKRFAPIKGNTPFRIYCKKSSANPAVYKNVEGITVELL